MPIRNAKTPENRIYLLETLLRAGSWTYDLTSREVTWSPGLFRLIGLDPNAVMASNALFDSLVHPDDRLSHEEIIERASAGELSLWRFRIIRPDGRLIWLDSRIDRQYNRQGKMAILHGVVQEVTSQEKLRTDHIRLTTINSSLVKFAGGELWRANPEGKLLDFSNWVKFTGETADPSKDYHQLSAVHPDDRVTFQDAWQTGVNTRQMIELSVRVRRHDGIYQRFKNRIVPVMDAHGMIVEWHGMSWLVDEAIQSGTMIQLKSAHIRAARTLLDWSAQSLALASEVSFSTVRRMELDATSVRSDSVERVKKALETQGVRFSVTPHGYVSIASALENS